MATHSKLLFVNADGEIEESAVTDEISYAKANVNEVQSQSGQSLLLKSEDGTTQATITNTEITLAEELAMGANKISGILDGTNPQDAVTKSQMETAVGAVDLSGKADVDLGNILPTADVAFNTNKLTGLTDGALASQDAATVSQVEGLITAAAPNLTPYLLKSGGVMTGAIDFAGSTFATNLAAGSATGHAVEYDQMNTADNLRLKLDGTDTMTGALDMGTQLINNVVDPVSAQDAATKNYVDNVAEGLKPKSAVIAATDGAQVLATDFENGDTIDGVVLATNDRILIKDQASAAENGIYTVEATGAPTRATDFDEISPIDEIHGAYVPVQEGTANAGKFFVQAGTVTTVGVSDIDFVFFNAVASGVSEGPGIDVTTGKVSIDLLTASGLELNGAGDAAQLAALADILSTTTTEANSIIVAANGLSVKVDDSTLEGSQQGVAGAESLRVKAAGINENELNLTLGNVDAGSFLAVHTAGNYTAADTQIQGHLSGIDSELGINATAIGNNATAITDHATDLASTLISEGASLIGLHDAAGNYTATTVEAALAEVYSVAASGGSQFYTVNAGVGVQAGDLMYINAADEIDRLDTTATGSAQAYGFGLAKTTQAGGTSVESLHDGQIVPGVLTGGTAAFAGGEKVYFDSSVATGANRFVDSAGAPTVSQSRVWQVGIAKNANDLIIDINFVKKNS